ncbi:MAG: hypothetical protein LBV47_09755 [Bacteroidales bacterium]|jgi:hypothetical protein|nr:hypothetical protein [Bacteroidales bacterium]
MSFFLNVIAQESMPGFTWGNVSFFNLDVGESFLFGNKEIRLLELENNFNKIKVGTDTLWIKAGRRNLPVTVGNITIYVADNKNVKSPASFSKINRLLQKDALIAVSYFNKPLLDFSRYVFPVNFNNGFLWNFDIDMYLFSRLRKDEMQDENSDWTHEGIVFDMSNTDSTEKHWLTAIENSRVVWINRTVVEEKTNISCVLIESALQPGVYYIYDNLDSKNIEIKTGQKLIKGDIIGTASTEDNNGFLQFAVVKSDTVPSYDNRYCNTINFFPQLFQLYYRQNYVFPRSFSKGIIKLGIFNGAIENIHAFEDYSGKGWLLGKWNTVDRVEYASDGYTGNARLKYRLFAGTSAECINPDGFYDYEISVPNGTYRIRAKLGDIKLASWQKIMFEDVEVMTTELSPGEYKWTGEQIIKVIDGRLTVRIFVDTVENKPAGISEIVFQQMY